MRDSKVPTILNKGDKIAILPLAAPIEPGRLQSSVSFLEAEGFKIEQPLNSSNDYGGKVALFSAYDPVTRANALNAVLKDPAVKLILAAKGAYGSQEMLPHMDFAALRQSNKIIMGFSDITTVLNAAVELSGVCAVHGPTLESGFADTDSNPEKLSNARLTIDILCGRADLASVNFHALNAGSVEGIIKGGNLGSLVALCGTPWQPSFKGAILFIEEVGEGPYRVHRNLLQLKQSGALDGLKGILLGTFSKCEHPKNLGPDIKDVFKDQLLPLGVPIIQADGFGHTPKNLPLILGRPVRLSEQGLNYISA